MSDRLTVCLVSRLTRVSARNGGCTAAETNAETCIGSLPPSLVSRSRPSSTPRGLPPAPGATLPSVRRRSWFPRFDAEHLGFLDARKLP